MDKNTITGLILIAAVLIGFTLLNRPSAEDIAKQKERARIDSIAYAQTRQQEAPQIDTLPKIETSTSDFFVIQKIDSVTTRIGDTVQVAQPSEELIPLENDKVKIVLSTKGGKMVSAQLKEY